MNLLQNPVVLSTVNKLAFAIAAWLVHRGTVAADQQTSIENGAAGIMLGLVSIAVTLWQSYQHKNDKAVIAQVETISPVAVAQAREIVNSKTPNGL